MNSPDSDSSQHALPFQVTLREGCAVAPTRCDGRHEPTVAAERGPNRGRARPRRKLRSHSGLRWSQTRDLAPPPRNMSDNKPAGSKAGGKGPATKESKQDKRKRVASEIDDLFAVLPKVRAGWLAGWLSIVLSPLSRGAGDRSADVAKWLNISFLPARQRAEKQPEPEEAAATGAREDDGGAAAEDDKAKRRKEKEHYLSNGEKLAVQRRAALNGSLLLSAADAARNRHDLGRITLSMRAPALRPCRRPSEGAHRAAVAHGG